MCRCASPSIKKYLPHIAPVIRTTEAEGWAAAVTAVAMHGCIALGAAVVEAEEVGLEELGCRRDGTGQC